MAADVEEAGFAGEGLGFQMCRGMRIERSSMYHNAGNDFHLGASSTGARFVDCTADANDLALVGNTRIGPADNESAGIYVAPQAQDIWLTDNRIERCFP